MLIDGAGLLSVIGGSGGSGATSQAGGGLLLFEAVAAAAAAANGDGSVDGGSDGLCRGSGGKYGEGKAAPIVAPPPP